MGLAKTINKLSRVDSLEEEFVKMVEFKVKKIAGKPRSSSKTFKPSSIFACKREQFYLFKNYKSDGPRSVQPYLYLMGRSGSSDHLIIQEIIWDMKDEGVEIVDPKVQINRAKEMGINTSIRKNRYQKEDPYEVAFYNSDYNISGKTDGILVFQDKLVIFEFKTEDHYKWTRRVLPEPDHVRQGATYSLCLGINYVLFVYQDRNYKRFKAYLVEITEGDHQAIIDYIETCNYFIDKNILPEAEKDRCKYCRFKTQCRADGPEQVVLE